MLGVGYSAGTRSLSSWSSQFEKACKQTNKQTWGTANSTKWKEEKNKIQWERMIRMTHLRLGDLGRFLWEGEIELRSEK